jgi:hypothetical protein
VSDGRRIGRIFRSATRLPSDGFAATLDDPKAAFVETWRRWLSPT